MKLKIGMQKNFKKFFTVDEVAAVAEMKRDNFKEINENGIELSDFTSHNEKDVLKITLKFCKYNNANFFSDNRLENIDILINVIFYDGYKFADEMYYYSDFIMRVDDNFKVYCRTAEVIWNAEQFSGKFRWSNAAMPNGVKVASPQKLN